MNLFDSSFLCLDIGTSTVRGIAHRVKSGRIDKSATFEICSFDTVFAIKAVIDELERQIGAHFDSAYITGNFGESTFEMAAKNTTWGGEHKITISDVRTQLSQIAPPDGFFPMHVVPLRYDTPSSRNMLSPVGAVDHQLISAFGAIFYSSVQMQKILAILRRAHIQSNAFFDPHFVQNSAYRTAHQNTMFIDLGAQFTTASIWTDRGPVWHKKISRGGTDITNEISEKLNISFDDADRIKRAVASMMPNEMDRFTPADTAYEFSRADVGDIVLPAIVDIAQQLRDTSAAAFAKYKPVKIVLSGGGSEIEYIGDFFENIFAIPVQNQHGDASIRAISTHIWNAEAPHINAYMARRDKMRRITDSIARLFKRKKKPRARFIPIMPSTLCFNMRRPDTYTMFRAGGISIIHVDIMDGFYVDRIAGSIDELKFIHAHTDAHLHVHLMTESPSVWAADAIAAGAGTVILSTNTSGLRTALREIRAAGGRAGIALNPESSVSLLKPILHEIDEVMLMAVAPGAAGQSFNPGTLHKISILDATRKKYKLKFTISVDGGINPDTAARCWAAGADLLVSGSYLARASDFPLAVQSLLKKSNQ